jgi:hypothetical protein
VKCGKVVRVFLTVLAGLASACGLNATGENPTDGGLGSGPDATVVESGSSMKPDVATTGQPRCVIDKKTYASGEVDPSNPCESCQPDLTTSAWTDVTGGKVCGEGEICHTGACVHGCEIATVYYADGVVDPADPCESCQSSWSTTGWTALADGLACGTGEICASGKCGGACEIDMTLYMATSANPANPCEECLPGDSANAWSNDPNGTGCGGGEICNVGTCGAGCYISGTVEPPGTVSMASACQTCQPTVSTTEWSNLPDGTTCGTGTICHKGACGSGCEIGGVYYAAMAFNPNNACETCQPALTTTTWSNVVDGTTCGNNQICAGGTCGKQCVIGGTVYASGTTETGDACEVCEPGMSTTAWTTLTDGTTCGTGVTCVAGMCNGCVPATTQCMGNGVQTCGSNGQWGAAAACSASLTCVGTKCTGVCGPNQTECMGPDDMATCNASGAWGSAVACTNQTCVGNTCTGVCAPTQTKCVGNGVETCNGSGQWSAAVACAANKTCLAGACGGSCGPNETQCADTGHQETCIAGAWGPPVACNDETCVTNVCTGQCAPGETQCGAGQQPQTCSATGTWQNSGAACSGSTPSCVAGTCECTNGTLQCNGSQPQTCTGGVWGNTGAACSGSTPNCVNGVCDCTNGALQCSGSQPQTCAGGTWGNTGPACSGSTPDCVNGACDCTNGALQCNGSQPQTCTGGTWGNTGAACSGSTPNCVNGACDCTNGALQCNGSQPQTCAGGTWGNTGAACSGSTPNCVAGVCDCTDGALQCNGAQLQTCTAGAWGNTGPACSGVKPNCGCNPMDQCGCY